MYSKILVPLDGSKLAESALPHAESMAHRYDAELILLSVILPQTIVGHPPIGTELYQETLDALRDDAKQYLTALKGEFAAKKIRAAVHLGFGPVVGEIVESADKLDADLIIIASHGRSGLERVFFGSVASGVLNRIEKPIMVIRPSH